MMSTVIGGAMLPHAPQFFTMPDTEDKANVEHVRTVAAEIGQVLRHRRLMSTAIYAKTDVAALRALARPWPGGAA